MLAIRLSQDVEARLEFLAKLTGRTKTFYAKEAIVQHLAELEARYLPKDSTPVLDADVKEALLAWKAFEETGLHLDWDSEVKPWMLSWFSDNELPAPVCHT